jgi:DNA mismatch endonuclease, patch repair protein
LPQTSRLKTAKPGSARARDRAAFEAAHRSRTMASVSSRRTDLEQRLAKEMWRLGLRGWRRGRRTAGAKPDFVFVGARVAVFVDGCFWHGCPACAKRPASNVEYWRPKIARNRARDAQQTRALRAEGWAVIRLWGHEIERDTGECAALIREATSTNSE